MNLRRLAAVPAATLLALAGSVLPTASGAPASAAPSSSAAQFRIQVRQITPSAPLPSTDERPFSVVLSLTNLSGRPLKHVTISGVRGDPIGNRDALTSVLSKPFPSSGVPIKQKHPTTVDLPADDKAHDVVFATTTGIPYTSGICLCHDAAIYPLSFSASYTDASVTHLLGTTGTYMPAFERKPAPVRVSWVWPLIDKPHRLADDRTFTDDQLGSSVSYDGRLERSLSTLGRVDPSVPMTIVLDPELIDELQVMAAGKYTVQDGRRRVAGTGSAAAGAWLERLRAVLQTHPGFTLQATPYGDPDVQSLSSSGLSWRTGLPAATAKRVAAALGGRPLGTNLVWPGTGRLGSNTLRTLVAKGAREAVLATSAVTPADGDDGSVPDGIARLSRLGHRIGVGLTDATVERYLASVVTRNHAGLNQLPRVLAEIAVRAAQDPATPHDLVLTPPRYVDASPEVAARAINDTSSSTFSSPVALGDMLAPNGLPGHISHLADVGPSAPRLSSTIIEAAHHVTSVLPAVDAMLGVGLDPAVLPKGFRIGVPSSTLAAALPVALQRCESSFWVADSDRGARFIGQLAKRADALVAGVHIVPPNSGTGTYTLASSNSPLPVTVANTLAYPVAIELRVRPTNGLPGFVARDIGAQPIPAHSQTTLHLPTSIQRSGRIQIRAQLLTPDLHPLNDAIPLSVHSTAFGTVGVVITLVAGAVLALALLVRWLRWFRRRRRGALAQPPPRASGTPDEDAGPDTAPEADPQTSAAASTAPTSAGWGPAP